MGRKPKTEPDDKEQSARFIETAKRIKSDNDEEAFKLAIKKIIQNK